MPEPFRFALSADGPGARGPGDNPQNGPGVRVVLRGRRCTGPPGGFRGGDGGGEGASLYCVRPVCRCCGSDRPPLGN